MPKRKKRPQLKESKTFTKVFKNKTYSMKTMAT